MPHLHVEATTDQLLQAVAQLPPEELSAFVERVLRRTTVAQLLKDLGIAPRPYA